MKTHEFAPILGRDSFPVLLSAWGLLGHAAEIGTHRGEYAEVLLHNWPGHLICIDPWTVPEGYEDQAELLKTIGGHGNRAEDYNACRSRLSRFKERVKCVRATSEEAIALRWIRTLDFVYIDGDHSAKAVAFDIVNWWDRVRVGGILAGHDYVCTGEPDGGHGMIIRPVVDAFARERELTVWVVREVGDRPWSWYLVKPNGAPLR